jgi:hypothetical protein
MNIGFLYLLLSFSPIKVCHSFFIFPLSFCSSWFLFVLFCGYLLKLWKFDFGTWYYLWTMISVRVKKNDNYVQICNEPSLIPSLTNPSPHWNPLSFLRSSHRNLSFHEVQKHLSLKLPLTKLIPSLTKRSSVTKLVLFVLVMSALSMCLFSCIGFLLLVCFKVKFVFFRLVGYVFFIWGFLKLRN